MERMELVALPPAPEAPTREGEEFTKKPRRLTERKPPSTPHERMRFTKRKEKVKRNVPPPGWGIFASAGTPELRIFSRSPRGV